MTNPMLAELDAVVRLSERATPGKVELHTSCSWRRIVAERGRPFLVPTIDPDRHQNMDTTESAEFVVALVNWFRTHHAEIADMAKRLEAAERDASPVSALEALLPGTYYMDPPDGGDVSVYEQLRRMAKDAARYRWIRNDQTGRAEDTVLVDRYGDVEVKIGDSLDAAIDATQEGEG